MGKPEEGFAPTALSGKSVSKSLRFSFLERLIELSQGDSITKGKAQII